MLITIVLLIYFSSTFHTSLLYNVFKITPNSKLVNTIYYIYNRSSFTLFISWLILQNYPNGQPSKREEVKAFLRKYLSGSKKANVGKDSLLEKLIDKLNKNLHNVKDKKIENDDDVKKSDQLKVDKIIVTRKVSSSESTSDLSDHLYVNDEQDTNNNSNNSASFDFYNRKLIDLPEEDVFKSDKQIDKNIMKYDSKEEANSKETSKRSSSRKSNSNLMYWVKLSKSIYYSHFFYLLYSLFNVNNLQKSDLWSMLVSVHSKLFWAYMLAYPFHLLIEAPISNLTNRLIERISLEKSHKD